MAHNETEIAAPPDRIFEVLSEPENYGYWVVGSRRIRDADADWPAPGSRFHHVVGFGPIEVNDHTEVIESMPPHFIKLRARARPLGTAFVSLRIAPAEGGSKVTMTEDPADPLTAFIFNPLTHLLVRGRNVESLDRLRELAERDGRAGDSAA